MNGELKSRVLREKGEHEDNAILEKSFQFKNIFCHVLNSPTIKRLKRDEEKIYYQSKGLKVLDIGCGFGERSIEVAKFGGEVVGIDISKKNINFSEKLASEKNLSKKCDFLQMDVHEMSFENNKFDLVIGRGIIHHLDMKVSLLEIKRVLKNGGTALFVEPLDSNPLLKLFRFLTPFARTADEKPLTKKDLKWISKEFYVENSYYGIFSTPLALITSIILRPYPCNIILKISDIVEQYFNKLEIFHPFNQYVLIKVKKII